VAKARRWYVRMLRGIAAALFACVLLSVGAVALLRWVDPPFTAVMLQQPGDLDDLSYDWVDRSEIAWAAAQAVIASEDQRFLEHNGIDFVSLDKAFAEYRDGGDMRGASTITQQVAKNLFLWQGRNPARKALEAYFTVLIELMWPKERILEVYLNVAELGPNTFGVEAAAQEFFGAHAVMLEVPQAALLAAVLPNPRRLSAVRPSDYVRDRQAWIVAQVYLLDERGHYRGIDW
jgi:monofunctional glycosyltransferase